MFPSSSRIVLKNDQPIQRNLTRRDMSYGQDVAAIRKGRSNQIDSVIISRLEKAVGEAA
jgi:hypothetical protein